MDTNLQTQLVGEIGTLITIVTPLLCAIYALYKAKIKDYFEAKIATINNADARALAQSTLDHVDNLVTKEVTNADVTLKPAILSAIADGKVSADELTTLKTIVKENVLKQLTEDSKTTLFSTVADVDTYLNSTVETILANLKLDPTSAVSKTVLSSISSDTTATNIKNVETVQAPEVTNSTVVDMQTQSSTISPQ